MKEVLCAEMWKVFVLLVLIFHGLVPDVFSQENEADVLLLTRTYAQKSEQSTRSKEKIANARLGFEFAEKCVRAEPKRGACHYYRGVNRGLILESKISGIKKTLGKMVEDFEKARELDPGYEGGGASRALGYLYLRLPALGLGEKYKRDLGKAMTYCNEALQFDAEHPDNWLLKALILEKKNDRKGALTAAKQGVAFFSRFKDVPREYVLIHDDLLKLEKKLQKSD